MGSVSSLLIVGFSFTSAWVFGREYTDNTIKDLLVKPISRMYSVLSKFIIITIWNIFLACFVFGLVTIAGLIIGVKNSYASLIFSEFSTFFITSVLIMLVSTTSAFLASITKGYLAPIGLSFVIIIISNIAMQPGFGLYFPWTIPILPLTETPLNIFSVFIVLFTGIAGFLGTIAWWRYTEYED